MNDTSVMVHVRFAPDGSVVEIGERPQWAAAQEWYDVLCNKIGGSFEFLSGGRGVFRAARADIDSLKAAAVQ